MEEPEGFKELRASIEHYSEAQKHLIEANHQILDLVTELAEDLARLYAFLEADPGVKYMPPDLNATRILQERDET